ncbi:MAG TPA: hypothetical protein ENJ42_00195, partial [Hellea balneolensis]|nr:hypothetical protein [Hellea balneolensis]
MGMDVDIRCVWDAKARLGESPIWVDVENALYWVDIKAPAIHKYVPATDRKTTWPVPEKIGSLVYDEINGFRAAIKTGFVNIEFGHGGEIPTITKIIDPEVDLPNNRFNDGKLDADGRFWAGTMDDLEKESTGSWWRLGLDGQIRKMDTGYMVTNGPAFDDPRRLIYLTDSAKQTIYVAKYLSIGEIANKRVFKTFGEGEGYPDGMTTDADGNLWVAFWDGGCIRKINPQGEVIRTIQLPVPRPTSITISDDPDVLYVTSASTGLSEDQLAKAPLSGGIFKVTLPPSNGRRRNGKNKTRPVETTMGRAKPTSVIGREEDIRPSRLGEFFRNPIWAFVFATALSGLVLAPIIWPALKPQTKYFWIGAGVLAGLGLVGFIKLVMDNLSARLIDRETELRAELKQELLDELSKSTKAADVARRRTNSSIQSLRNEVKDIESHEALSKTEIEALKAQLENQTQATRAMEDRISHRINAAHGRIYTESQKVLRDLQRIKSEDIGKSAAEIAAIKATLDAQKQELKMLDQQFSKRL